MCLEKEKGMSSCEGHWNNNNSMILDSEKMDVTKVSIKYHTVIPSLKNWNNRILNIRWSQIPI